MRQDEIKKLAALNEDGEDEALLAFLTANMPDVEPSSDFTALVMQRVEQYEEVRAMLGLRWRRLLTVKIGRASCRERVSSPV
mgnify:CR=1 FL=1